MVCHALSLLCFLTMATREELGIKQVNQLCERMSVDEDGTEGLVLADDDLIESDENLG